MGGTVTGHLTTAGISAWRASGFRLHCAVGIDGQNASAGWQVRSVILLEIDLAFDRRLFGSISRFGGHNNLMLVTEVGDDPVPACCAELRSAIGTRDAHRPTMANGRRNRWPL